MNVELLTKILAVSCRMTETRDLEQLLQLALSEMLNVIGGETGYIVLVQEEGQLDFRVRAGTGADTGDELSRSIFDDVILMGKPLVITDALADERYAAKSSIINLKLRSVMCVPLTSNAITIGAIYVESRTVAGAFRQEDLEPFILFANQAAVSIENAMIIAHLEERVTARTAELERSWQDAVEANRMRTTVLGQVAHDMRTPLSSIAIGLRMMNHPKVGTLNADQLDWAGRVTLAVQQMERMTQDLFNLTKIELGVLEISPEQVDLKQLLEQVYQVGTALPWPDTVRFESDLPGTLPQVWVDPGRMQQVLMNLITNAQKYTEQGSVTLYARDREPGEILIGVQDTGEGIPDEAQSAIFERFRQFDRNAARRVAGAGLGLAICKELVEKQGGRIWVSSAPGQGSNFVVALPL